VSRSPLLRILIALFPVDASFSALMAYAFLLMMGIEGEGATTAFIVYAGLWVVKVATWMTICLVRLRPLARWSSDESRMDPGTLVEIAAAAYRAPFTACLAYSGAILCFYLVYVLVLYVGCADSVPLGPSNVVASVVAGFAVMFASMGVSFPITEKLMAPTYERISLVAQERGITIRAGGLAFRARLVVFALVLVLTPILYMSSSIYMNDALAGQRDLKRQAEIAIEAEAGRTGARVADALVFTYDADRNVIGREAERALAEHPRLARLFERAAADAPSGVVAHPRHGVVAFRVVDDRRIGVVIPHIQTVTSGTTLLLFVFLVMGGVWAAMTALFMSSSTGVPVTRISNALANVSQGEVSSAPKVPVYHHDEVGSLAQNYNTSDGHADVPPGRVVAVLRVVEDGEAAALVGDVDPGLRRLLVAGRRPDEVPVRDLERRAVGDDRRREAKLEQAVALVPVEDGTDLHEPRVGAQDQLLRQRRALVRRLDPQDRAHRALLDEAH
jgi:HAMP domain-containing protein